MTIFAPRRVTILVMPPRIGPRRPVHVFLALWRDKAGLTQEQLGLRFKPPVDKGTVSRWENAKAGKLTLGVIAAYAEALGKKAHEMYFPPPKEGEDEEPSLDDRAAELSNEMRQHVADMIESLKGRRRRAS